MQLEVGFFLKKGKNKKIKKFKKLKRVRKQTTVTHACANETCRDDTMLFALVLQHVIRARDIFAAAAPFRADVSPSRIGSGHRENNN